ncbi:MAG: hypothetical protein LBN07_00805 [Christensenellaceae bacterium]|nr:hypothetical protein [Christensenellaceae bacterium]
MKYFIDLADARNRALHKLLFAQGFDAGPLEFDEAGIYIFSPAKRFEIDEVKKLPHGSMVFAGNIKEDIKKVFEEKALKYVNFLDYEDFAVKNAVLTAEGTLPVLIEQTDKSVFEQKVLILGLGRIGKALAILFGKLGIDYSCMVTEKELDSASIYAKDYFTKKELLKNISKFDAIINTIPIKVFEDEDLKHISNKTMFIELASAKCFDDTKAEFKFVWALALPTKYMPMSAAGLMKEVIVGVKHETE